MSRLPTTPTESPQVDELDAAADRVDTVRASTLRDVLEQSFSPLNVTILLRQQAASPTLPRLPVVGLPEDSMAHRAGMITKRDIRLLTLGYLQLHPGEVLWDIGAGSGSVSIEAAQMASDGSVYAIEMDAEEHGLIRENAERFGVANVNAILGRAPEAFDELPDPDAVFIAGAGREVIRLTEAAYARLRRGGRLVVNTKSIDHLSELRQMLSQHSSHIHIWMINLSRGTDQLDRLTFEPLKPSFLLAVTKS